MGISRRKAGTLVRCPVCASSVAVPAQSTDDPPAKALSGVRKQTKVEAPPPIFERSDFDQLLHEPVRREAVVPIAVPDVDFRAGPTEERRENGSPSAEFPQPKLHAAAGLLLTPRRATILAVFAIISLALVFALGYWFGAAVGR
jgi:hypothetical protein